MYTLVDDVRNYYEGYGFIENGIIYRPMPSSFVDFAYISNEDNLALLIKQVENSINRMECRLEKTAKKYAENPNQRLYVRHKILIDALWELTLLLNALKEFQKHLPLWIQLHDNGTFA
jgi:hypothetical protein